MRRPSSWSSTLLFTTRCVACGIFPHVELLYLIGGCVLDQLSSPTNSTPNFFAKLTRHHGLMYDLPIQESDSRCVVRSMGLNDELGVVTHVFSDKTGTLTCNVMDFRKCSINGTSYGEGTTEIGLARLRRMGQHTEAARLKASKLRRPSLPPFWFSIQTCPFW